MMKPTYNPTDIETEAQIYWEQNHSFQANEDSNAPKFYCLSMLPYPSGELHMGHVRNYTIGDVIARHARMCGKNVLQPISWDAFGLPAENAALKNKSAPAKWTYANIKQMRGQFKRLGYAYDWSREFPTCKPEYYRWEQWLFIRMLKKGLAYKKNAMVNWDPVDQTVLANEQVIDGRGWRSGAIIERREMSSWFLKITAYAEELLQDLEQLTGWPEQVRTMQRNWIGKSEGLEIDFPVANSEEKITIFTTRPDTLLGATYLVIAPEHSLAIQLAKTNTNIAAFLEQCRHIKMAEAELAGLEKVGVPTPLTVIHPLSGETLPIWIANYVLMEYGSGAVMAVPAHDQRDFEFAQKYHLPVKIVIQTQAHPAWDYSQSAMIEKGQLINSGKFNGMDFKPAFAAIAKDLAAQHQGQRKVHYRLRDWGVSRQRYWGTPIPIINCDHCGPVPVPEQDLPVLLPENITLDGPQSPLKTMPSFYETTCPHCGKKAKRETDTFDTFMESSWYFMRNCCPDQNQAMLDQRANYWMPVDQYVGGIEHAILHLLYARFINKVIRDEGLLKNNEPFTNLLTQGMVLKDSVKMSKSKGNVVSPTELVDQYGADTVRLFMIFAAPPELSLEWSDRGIEGAHRFLKRLWSAAEQVQTDVKNYNQAKTQFHWQQASAATHDIRKQLHEALQQANFDIERLQFNTVVSAAMKIFNLLPKAPLADPEQRALTYEIFSILLRLLAPITPHICHYLWRELGYSLNNSDVIQTPWPVVDKQALKTAALEIIVQVNGKLRARLNVPNNASREEIERLALADENVQRFLTDKPQKIIIVPNKLINIVV